MAGSAPKVGGVSEPKQAGPLLDALGVTLNLDEHDQLTDVLIIGRTTDFESGDTGIVIGNSAGLDWITQYGLLGAARYILESGEIEET